MKKVLIITVLFLVMLFPSFTSGMPVLDVANLAESIELAYNYGIQIENTIAQVKAQLESVKQAYQQMMAMDWSSLSDLGDSFRDNGANPMDWIRDTRDATQKVLSVVDHNMNLVNNLENSLLQENISFGGMSVSLLDLVGLGKKDGNIENFLANAVNYTNENVEKLAEVWAGGLSYEERESVMNKYGMSPKNYASWKLVGYELDRLVNNNIIKNTEEGASTIAAETAESAVTLIEAMNKVPEGSTYAQQQLLTSGVAEIELLLGKIIGNFGEITGLYANKIKVDQERIEAEKTDLSEVYEQAKKEKTAAFQDEFAWYHINGEKAKEKALNDMGYVSYSNSDGTYTGAAYYDYLYENGQIPDEYSLPEYLH